MPSQSDNTQTDKKQTDKKQTDTSQVQGEGDYRANARYTESVQDFVESGKVDEAARKAKPQTQQQADEMRRAEKEGASHAKGEQPQPGNPGK